MDFKAKPKVSSLILTHLRAGTVLKLAGCTVALNLSSRSVLHAMPAELTGSAVPFTCICSMDQDKSLFSRFFF